MFATQCLTWPSARRIWVNPRAVSNLMLVSLLERHGCSHAVQAISSGQRGIREVLELHPASKVYTINFSYWQEHSVVLVTNLLLLIEPLIPNFCLTCLSWFLQEVDSQSLRLFSISLLLLSQHMLYVAMALVAHRDGSFLSFFQYYAS